jgi:hypothetical protein
MSLINQVPPELVPIHNCLNYGLYMDTINILTGTQATFSVTFSNGGTATDGTVIVIQGQKFEILDTVTENNGYNLIFNGFSDIQRATWFYDTIKSTLFFDPSIVTIVQFGNVVTVTYNQVGQQPNWQFENSGITQIAFYSPNGIDRVDLTGASYVWAILQDRTDLSLPPLKIVSDRILPILMDYDNSVVPTTIAPSQQYVNPSDLIKSQVSTILPNIYSPVFTQIEDSYFRKKIFMRAGWRFLSDCEIQNREFADSSVSWMYNCLLQSKLLVEGSYPLEQYTDYGKPLLIKDTYSICRTTSFFVWSICPEAPLEVVYYSAAGAELESTSFTYGSGTVTEPYFDDVKPTYMNVGGFGQSIPSNCAYYILNYMNADGSEVLHAVRFNVTDCNCVVGEFIFCTDLGAYETITFEKLTKQDIAVSSDIINSKDGCTLSSLIKGNRSIVNTNSEVVYTMTSKFQANEKEIEFIEQFKRSQSFYMKYFFEAADSFGYIKVIPESINFAPIELGKANELQITFRLNKSYKSHPQNEAVYI